MVDAAEAGVAQQSAKMEPIEESKLTLEYGQKDAKSGDSDADDESFQEDSASVEGDVEAVKQIEKVVLCRIGMSQSSLEMALQSAGCIRTTVSLCIFTEMSAGQVKGTALLQYTGKGPEYTSAATGFKVKSVGGLFTRFASGKLSCFVPLMSRDNTHNLGA
eukprot:1528156-Amphidinium_carterae.1